MSRADRRAAARLASVQALYQMEVAAKSVQDVFLEFEMHWIGKEIEGDQYNEAEIDLFRAIVSGVQEDQFAIDQAVDETLAEGWPFKRIEALMRAILRAAFYELKAKPEIPARVVISEYVDISAAFFGKDESGMINAVLDALARKIRAREF